MSPVILKPSSSLWEWDTLKKRRSFCHTMLNLNSRVYKRYFNNIQIYQLRQQNETRITRQVTWLVVTEVRSESFGLVTERRHYNGRPISIYHSAPLLGQFYFSSSSVVSRTFSAVCARYARIRCSGIILTSRLPWCQISFLSRPPLLS